MIGSTGLQSSISSVYNSTSRQLSDALTKIASGKKFMNAAEDITGFLRSQSLQVDISGYEQVKQDLTSVKSFTSAAVQVSSSIYESLTKMKDVASQYAAAAGDSDKQAGILADFDATKAMVAKTLGSSYVDGKNVTALGGATIKKINLDPDGNSDLDVKFATVSDPADISGLDVTDAGAVSDVQAEIDNMLTYLSDAKSFDAIVDQQLKLTDTIVTSKQAVKSLITDIDEADAMNKVLDLSLRQQASVAMMVQGNMIQNNISRLYE